MKPTPEQLLAIVQTHLNSNIPTLETRKSDSLDFFEVSVWTLQNALLAAFELGANSVQDERVFRASAAPASASPEFILFRELETIHPCHDIRVVIGARVCAPEQPRMPWGTEPDKKYVACDAHGDLGHGDTDLEALEEAVKIQRTAGKGK